jgi:hypothetical protein
VKELRHAADSSWRARPVKIRFCQED